MRFILAGMLILLGTAGFTCQDMILEPISGHPGWVDDLIRTFKEAPVGNPPQTIWKYEYNGTTVFYVPPQCCDQYSDLYNFFGITIGHPDGGLSGSGDGRCRDFFAKRTKEVLVWKDDRTRH